MAVMLKLGDSLRVRGPVDRLGCPIPAATWTVVLLDRIDGSSLYACIARGYRPGADPVWIAGQVDAVGRPGHPTPPMRGAEGILWRIEQIAREDHAERVAGEVN
jgi:hypothetical protein